ncbi:glycosyltransferase, partial [Methylobacterium sp. B1]|uniref:glycosyltransferase n=1 Tax=Methylobacterium sp. B1 TaxID=91459 RepID=UPI0020734613
EKGLHLAIDAARAAGLPLTFAGPKLNPGYWAAEIAPRMGPDLTHLGHLAHRDLAHHLGRARVAIVSPRWEEPFGLVVAEALACGTPVAAFRRGAMPDILDASCGRLARPDDPQDLAVAIREAAGLSRRACRDRAEALHSRSPNAGNLLCRPVVGLRQPRVAADRGGRSDETSRVGPPDPSGIRLCRLRAAECGVAGRAGHLRRTDGWPAPSLLRLLYED